MSITGQFDGEPDPGNWDGRTDLEWGEWLIDSLRRSSRDGGEITIAPKGLRQIVTYVDDLKQRAESVERDRRILMAIAEGVRSGDFVESILAVLE
jgi:hypothetical protein